MTEADYEGYNDINPLSDFEYLTCVLWPKAIASLEILWLEIRNRSPRHQPIR